MVSVSFDYVDADETARLLRSTGRVMLDGRGLDVLRAIAEIKSRYMYICMAAPSTWRRPATKPEIRTWSSFRT